MTPLHEALRGIQSLALDSAPVIYFVEANPRYDAVVTEVFRQFVEGTIRGLTSVVTLTEVLVVPMRIGDSFLARAYRELLLNSTDFATVPVTSEIAIRAAELCARYGLRTPDALQIATALAHRCDAFLTNDARLKQVDAVRVLVLDDLAEEVSGD